MITIKYRLSNGMANAGIHTERTLNTNSRNLMQVAEVISSVRKRLVSAYGNVGCGAVWVEVDGVRVESCDLEKLTSDNYKMELQWFRTDSHSWSRKPETRTQRANELLQEISSGSYEKAHA